MPDNTHRTPEPSVPVVTPARIDRAENAAESYSKLEAEILALPEDQIGRVTTDVPQAAAIALGALPNLLKLRQDFHAFTAADSFTKKVDTLQDYAMAAFYAHIRSVPDASDNEVTQLLERGKPVREQLLSIAEGLVAFGLFDATLVASIRGGQGHLDTAKDLVALAALFNANWEQVENKVPFEHSLVDEARHVGAHLLHAIGVTGVGAVRNDKSYDWLSLRARAFRLLVNQYDEIRRAVTFLRWHHGDAQAFAPALHVSARKVSSSQKSSANGASKDELPSSEEPKLANSTRDVPPGMPGENPFMS